MFSESAGVVRERDRPSDSSQTATILLVEDEERVREVMELTLRLSGYHVLAVESANKALEIIEKYDDTIHLMVTDFALPHMNGVALASRLKRSRPFAKVLHISGFPKQEVQSFHETTERAALEFLQKPFTPDVLENKVRKMLDDDA